MTVIVAARTTHRVGRKRADIRDAITIASDTQLTDGWEKTTGAYPKIWAEEKRLIFGAAGLVAAWQAVQYHVTWPHYAETQDWEEWLVREINPLVTGSLSNAELLHRRRGVIDTNLCLIVATGDKLASIDCVGGVVVPRKHCAAIGSGYAEALGSLGKGPWTSDDVIRAAFAATETNLGCGAPIYFATTIDYEIQEADLAGLQ